MANNMSLKNLNPAEIRKLPLGTPIFDGNMDIYIKRDNDLWESETGELLTTGALLVYPHTPLRPYIPRDIPRWLP